MGSQNGAILQSIWISGRGAQKELDEAKLRFAAAEVLCTFLFISLYFRCEISSMQIIIIVIIFVNFCNGIQGDHVTFLNVYKGFFQSGKSSQWCHKNFVNYHAMVCFFFLTTIKMVLSLCSFFLC